VLPEPGMSYSVCQLHLILSHVEMYERNTMMMMMMMNCKIFPMKYHLASKTSFLGFIGTLLVRVSASTSLNLGSNRFKPSWQKQVSTRVSATLAETGFCRSFWARFYPKLFVYSCRLCFVLFDFVQYGAIRILLPSIALEY